MVFPYVKRELVGVHWVSVGTVDRELRAWFGIGTAEDRRKRLIRIIPLSNFWNVQKARNRRAFGGVGSRYSSIRKMEKGCKFLLQARS